MKQRNNSNSSYLDVSELVLKEHSPLFKARPLDPPIEINNSQIQLLDVSPIIDGKITLSLTPLFNHPNLNLFPDPSIDELDFFTLDEQYRPKQRKNRRNRPRIPSSWYIVENELEGIIQQNDEDCLDDHYSEFESEDSNDESEGFQDNEQLSQQQQLVEAQNEKLSFTIYEHSNYQFKCPEWQAQNPKKQLISKLKAVLVNSSFESKSDKVSSIKNTFHSYLCDYERSYFQEAICKLEKESDSVVNMIDILIEGVEQNFRKQIGGLSFQKRRLKLLRYLDKKKRRVWRKKVSYDCRKKVADGRLRIKGKFVTYQQACQQLKLPSIQGLAPDQLKQMLLQKLEQS